MPIDQKLIVRTDGNYVIRRAENNAEEDILKTKENQQKQEKQEKQEKQNKNIILSGKTRRKIVFSEDETITAIIENFTINLHRTSDFKKTSDFKLVSDEKGKKIDEENERLEEMLKNIQISQSSKYDAIMLKKRMEREFIQEIDISPGNRYLVCLTKFENETTPNIFIKEISSKNEIFRMTVKNFNTENWPIFKWFRKDQSPTGNDVFCQKIRSSLLFYDIGDMPKEEPNKKMDFSGKNEQIKEDIFTLRKFSISPVTSYFAVFLKSVKKDTPSQIRVYNYTKELDEKKAECKKVVSAEFAEFLWSNDGRTLMVSTSANSTKSYYTVARLYVFRNLGEEENEKDRKQKCFEVKVGRSTLHDFSFSTSGDRFAVIAFHPIKIKIFDTKKCEVIKELEPFRCNKIIWSPNDRFAWVAGIHNMSGTMSFWDMQKYECLGRGQHQGMRSFRWSSDGKFFLTASLSPWRNVDNGYKIWSFCGKLMAQESIEKMYQCEFVPMQKGCFIPFTPEILEKPSNSKEKDYLTKRPAEKKNNSPGINFKVPLKNSAALSNSKSRGALKSPFGAVKAKTERKIYGLPEKKVVGKKKRNKKNKKDKMDKTGVEVNKDEKNQKDMKENKEV